MATGIFADPFATGRGALGSYLYEEEALSKGLSEPDSPQASGQERFRSISDCVQKYALASLSAFIEAKEAYLPQETLQITENQDTTPLVKEVLISHSIEGDQITALTEEYFNEESKYYSFSEEGSNTPYTQDFVKSTILRAFANCTIGASHFPQSEFRKPELKSAQDIEKTPFVQALRSHLEDDSDTEWIEAAMKLFCPNAFSPDINPLSKAVRLFGADLVVEPGKKDIVLTAIRDSERRTVHLAASISYHLQVRDVSSDSKPKELTKAHLEKVFTIEWDTEKSQWAIDNVDLKFTFPDEAEALESSNASNDADDIFVQ